MNIHRQHGEENAEPIIGSGRIVPLVAKGGYTFKNFTHKREKKI